MTDEIKSYLSRIDDLKISIEELKKDILKLEEEQKNLPSNKKILEAYYEKMSNMPLTNLEKRELLKPEILSELSMDEYMALWKRLNPYFLTHVTRRGFRDHIGMIYHSAECYEFYDWFSGILKDKHLYPSIVVRNELRVIDKLSVKHFLEKSDVLTKNSKEEAIKSFNKLLDDSWAFAPKYPARTAIHFAAQIVSDGHYGSEYDNEIFFLYPSDVLASQYNFAFSTGESTFKSYASETRHNDIFIWTPSNSGISIDAGIVFLPEDAMVDPETGSKYDSEIKIVDGKKENKLIQDEEMAGIFIEWFESLDEKHFLIEAYKEFERPKGDFDSVDDFLRTVAIKEKFFIKILKKELLQLGIPKDAVELIMIYRDVGILELFSELMKKYSIKGHSVKIKEEYFYDRIDKIIKAANLNLKRAENPITSKEYWERYFNKYPEQKPKRLVFYKGNPTAAVKNFLKKMGVGQSNLSAEASGPLLGFEDKFISNMTDKNSKCWEGYSELKEIGFSVINEYYTKKMMKDIKKIKNIDELYAFFESIGLIDFIDIANPEVSGKFLTSTEIKDRVEDALSIKERDPNRHYGFTYVRNKVLREKIVELIENKS